MTAPEPNRPLTDEIDCWAKTLVTDGCWWWLGHLMPNGYGRIHSNVRGRSLMAHRIMYQFVRGPIPAGMVVDHLCRNHSCVNPWHMEIVTNLVNIQRGVSPSALNLAKTHCAHGHPFSPENTSKLSNGKRACKTCNRDRDRLKRARVHEVLAATEVKP